MSRRMERIDVLLRDEISRVLSSELRDPRLASMVSVTDVDTSADLSFARVYVSVLGDQTDKRNTLRALKSASGYVHRSIRHHLNLKTVPSLEFQIDESIEHGSEVLKLISEVAPGPEAGGPS